MKEYSRKLWKYLIFSLTVLCEPAADIFTESDTAVQDCLSVFKICRHTKKSTPPSAFLLQNDYLKKGGELIITYQLEYYEKNLISSIYIRCLSVYGYMISIKHEEIV